ncbi:hypothetical protein [Deefgea sp. CFH1-16]|uniref:hypothetical protein n=1 Tax=Deefgea sp. CFH1-16 TaxID=2675457 RepID=UPI0015F53F94|nr:hypothetical protein [Deefgea sp. CFH1-16]MBM5575807.1 hypothetical protein [Deefgea sp. CFH1-16]
MSEQTKKPDLCYSREGDDHCVRELQELISIHELDVGAPYIEYDLVQHPASHYFNIEDVIENMASAADDDAGEHAEGFPDLSDDEEAELNALISNWLDKKVSVNFFTAVNPREREITAGDLGERES